MEKTQNTMKVETTKLPHEISGDFLAGEYLTATKISAEELIKEWIDEARINTYSEPSKIYCASLRLDNVDAQ